VAVLSVRNRVSRCDVVELGEELFGVRLCTGTVEAILQRAAQALAKPYQKAGRARARQREPEHGRDRLANCWAATRAMGAFTDSHAFFGRANQSDEFASSCLSDSLERLLITG
jgi:hypothetical protein